MAKDEVKELNKILHIFMWNFQNKLENDSYSHVSELSTTEISVLQLLNDYPNSILKEICARLNIPKSTLTSAVNRLVKKGYVERISMRNDKRAFYLHITEIGKVVQADHLELEYSYLLQILGKLSAAEVEILLRLLKKSIGGDSHV